MKTKWYGAIAALTLSMFLGVNAKAAEFDQIDPRTAMAYDAVLSNSIEKYGILSKGNRYFDTGLQYAGLKDLDRSGTPELIVISIAKTPDSGTHDANIGVWTIENGAAKRTVDETVSPLGESGFVTFAEKDGKTAVAHYNARVKRGILYENLDMFHANGKQEHFSETVEGGDGFDAVLLKLVPGEHFLESDGAWHGFEKNRSRILEIQSGLKERAKGGSSSASDTPSAWAQKEVSQADVAGILTDAVKRDYQADITRAKERAKGGSSSASDTPSAWAQKEVSQADVAGILTDAVKRDYQADITRAQFVELMITVLEKGGKLPLGAAFSDCSLDYVRKARALGLIAGSGNNQFRPNDTITREELVKIIVQSFDYMSEKDGYGYYSAIGGIEDIDEEKYREVSPWARGDMLLAEGTFLIAGDGKSFMPRKNTTCEEAILFIWRAAHPYIDSLNGAFDDSKYTVYVMNA